MDKWKASAETHDKLKDLIASHHTHLVDVLDDIVIIFKEKASKKGDLIVYGKTSKAPAILSLLGEREWKFLIEIGYDAWQKLNDTQQTALLDHQLCFITGKEDEQTAAMKYSLTEPDVSYFTEEIARNGHWRPVINLDAETEEGSSNESVGPAPDDLGDLDSIF